MQRVSAGRSAANSRGSSGWYPFETLFQPESRRRSFSFWRLANMILSILSIVFRSERESFFRDRPKFPSVCNKNLQAKQQNGAPKRDFCIGQLNIGSLAAEQCLLNITIKLAAEDNEGIDCIREALAGLVLLANLEVRMRRITFHTAIR